MTALLGIDASTYQGAHGMSFAMFGKLHAAGVRFGIFRASIGLGVDASCAVNLRRAAKHAWAVGTYHYLEPGPTGVAQAEVYAKHAGPGICVLDVEQSGVTWRDVRDFVLRFRALKPGRPLLCYTSEWKWRTLTANADGEALFDGLWNALWTEKGTTSVAMLPASPPPAGYGGWRKADIWQYGPFHVGRTSLDGNAFYGTLAELKALGEKPATPLIERPRYLHGYSAMLDAVRASVAVEPAPDAEAGPAWDLGVSDARSAVQAAVSALRVAP